MSTPDEIKAAEPTTAVQTVLTLSESLKRAATQQEHTLALLRLITKSADAVTLTVSFHPRLANELGGRAIEQASDGLNGSLLALIPELLERKAEREADQVRTILARLTEALPAPDPRTASTSRHDRPAFAGTLVTR